MKELSDKFGELISTINSQIDIFLPIYSDLARRIRENDFEACLKTQIKYLWEG